MELCKMYFKKEDDDEYRKIETTEVESSIDNEAYVDRPTMSFSLTMRCDEKDNPLIKPNTNIIDITRFQKKSKKK